MDIERIPAQTAIARALEIVMANRIYGGRYDHDRFKPSEIEKNFSFYVEFGRGWAVSCNLTVELVWSIDSDHCTGKVHITWPSNAYSVAGAQATIALHQEVTNLAALVQSALDDMNIMGIKESVPH